MTEWTEVSLRPGTIWDEGETDWDVNPGGVAVTKWDRSPLAWYTVSPIFGEDDE